MAGLAVRDTHDTRFEDVYISDDGVYNPIGNCTLMSRNVTNMRKVYLASDTLVLFCIRPTIANVSN